MDRAAGIIIKEEKILLMHRQKPGRDYYVIPGGDIEENETPEIAVLREIKEETNLASEIDFLFFEFESDVFKRHEKFFMMKNISGKEKIGEPEISWQNEDNQYALEWVEIEKISKTNLLPKEIKEKIFETFHEKDSEKIAYCDM
jgi:ADP-ribose pyrophosphatase YjhB (NUDIX family)